MTEQIAGTLALVATAGTAVLLTLLAALLDRSGPIRLRHWVEEAGGSLEPLYQHSQRFEAFRYLLSTLARLSGPALLLVALVVMPGEAGILSAGVALGITVAVLAGAELGNRFLVGRRAEETLRRCTAAYRVLLVLTRPLLPLAGLFLPTTRGGESGPEDASPGEIEAFIDVGRREGILEEAEGELVRGLMDFGDTQVRSVMTPRVDIVCSSVDTPAEELVDLVLSSGHSRIPLYQGTIDDVVGILHVRDLLRFLRRPDGESLRSLLQPIHFVPETKTLAQLLAELQERHQELALVVDEYGGTEGLVTIEDLLEEIFGEIVDEHDEEEPAEVALPDGSWRIDARTHPDDLAELLGVEIGQEAYETVGGLIFGMLGHVPRVGDEVQAFGLRFVVEGADLRRARRVRVQPVEAPAQEGSGDEGSG